MITRFVDRGDSFSIRLSGLPADVKREIRSHFDRQVELGLLVPDDSEAGR